MSQNGQTHFKNIAANAAIFLKCLTILGQYALKVKSFLQRAYITKNIKLITDGGLIKNIND